MPEDGTIDIDCLPAKLLDDVRRLKTPAPPAVEQEPQMSGVQQIIPLAQMEEQAIRAALTVFGTSTAGKKKAALALGLSLATFYRKLHSFSN